MKKIILLFLVLLSSVACSNKKDIYIPVNYIEWKYYLAENDIFPEEEYLSSYVEIFCPDLDYDETIDNSFISQKEENKLLNILKKYNYILTICKVYYNKENKKIKLDLIEYSNYSYQIATMYIEYDYFKLIDYSEAK